MLVATMKWDLEKVCKGEAGLRFQAPFRETPGLE